MVIFDLVEHEYYLVEQVERTKNFIVVNTDTYDISDDRFAMPKEDYEDLCTHYLKLSKQFNL